MPLSFIPFNCIFMGLGCYNLFKLKILQRTKGANLLCPLDVRGLKMLSASGGFAPDPLTRGSAAGPRLPGLRPRPP